MICRLRVLLLSSAFMLMVFLLTPMVARAIPKPPKGTVPLYRMLLKTKYGIREFYTCNRTERNYQIKQGWEYVGITCYVYPKPWNFEPGDIVPGKTTEISGRQSATDGFPNVKGTWVGGINKDSKSQRMTISSQVGEKFVATTSVWKMSGTCSKSGLLVGKLIHTNGYSGPGSKQTWTMQLSSDGKILTGKSVFSSGGGHGLYWSR